MVVFQMRDMTPVEAFVLALDYDRAFELFEQHLLAHGGDSDALIHRQPGLEHLEPEERAAVEQALALDREGLVTADANGRWAFTTPLGD
jgi:hypothetical protein